MNLTKETQTIKEQVLATGNATILAEHDHFIIVKWDRRSQKENPSSEEYTIEAWMYAKSGMGNNYPYSKKLTEEQALRFCNDPSEGLAFLKDHHPWYKENA